MKTFLKTNWKRLLALIGLVCVIVLVVTFWPRPKSTLYVLPEAVPVDSVRSEPGQREQSATIRWDSLMKLQP